MTYLHSLIHLDLGHSIYSGRPILEILLERIPAKIELSLTALLLAVALAFPLGVLAALYRNTFLDVGPWGLLFWESSSPISEWVPC